MRLLIIAAAALTLAGCGGGKAGDVTNSDVVTRTLPDGTVVSCIVVSFKQDDHSRDQGQKMYCTKDR